MRHSIFYLAVPALLALSINSAIAQPDNKSTNNRNNANLAISSNTDNLSPVPDAFTDANNTTVAASIEAYPNPTKGGMITVKTECAGKVYFYSPKGMEKGECMVHEGETMIYLPKGLTSGAYMCKFEGVNGSHAEIRLVYEQ